MLPLPFTLLPIMLQSPLVALQKQAGFTPLFQVPRGSARSSNSKKKPGVMMLDMNFLDASLVTVTLPIHIPC